MSKKISRDVILTKLAELAFGGCNDAAKLAFVTGDDLEALDRLDLRALAGVHTSGNGGVEVKLIDRTKLIELLLAATEERPEPAAEAAGLISAIERSAEKIAGTADRGGQKRAAAAGDDATCRTPRQLFAGSGVRQPTLSAGTDKNIPTCSSGKAFRLGGTEAGEGDQRRCGGVYPTG